MRIIIIFIFFVLLASTAKAQTDFDFSCEPSDEEIIAEYGFTETGFLESTLIERMDIYTNFRIWRCYIKCICK